MTTLDLDALERAARAAEGKFRVYTMPGGGSITTFDRGGREQPLSRTLAGGEDDFLTLANPATILSLISDYRALQERVEGAEKALRPFAEASRIFDEAALHFGTVPSAD